jgi:23S rRNA pseudouridine1911/1915/1917 synthase
VSGVVIFARTSKALERLNEMFRSGTINKVYWAIVKKMAEKSEYRLEHYLIRNEKQNKSYAYDTPQKDAKHAVLIYKTMKESDNYTLLEINLKTGRHHQIRCQLAKIGYPIKGDLKYGFARSNHNGGISLHARKIEFTHPVSKQPISITAKVPDDKLWTEFENSFKTL